MKASYLLCLAVAAVLVISNAASAEGEVKVINGESNIGKAKDAQAWGVLKRVITDDADEDSLKMMKDRGCKIRHKLKKGASLMCPSDVAVDLGLRQARLFHVLDLEADQMIGADQVWTAGVTGSSAKVVILDTGIEASHIELNDSLLGQKDFVDNDDIAEDGDGHGTHVAGIITGNGINVIDGNYAKGVAPAAGIYMLRVCGASGCWEDDMVAAMEYAVESLDAKVMSISIGGGNYGSHCDSDPLAAKVNWVVDNNITVVVAAGNEGRGVSSPACASKAIAVGAVDKSGAVPWWSNRGSALDIIAPGVDILSTYSCLAAGDCTSTWYAWMDGTSMSAPHISGVAALLLEADPSLTDSEIKVAMYSTATPASACSECTRYTGRGDCRRQQEITCTQDIIGAGIVDAYAAYQAVVTPTTTTTLPPTTTTTLPPTTTTTLPPTTTTTLPPTTTTTVTTTSTTTTVPSVVCWSGDNQYLYRNKAQARKFCKCAQGTYGYQTYSSMRSRQTVYQYVDSGDNENWGVTTRTSRSPVYEVRCQDGLWYQTSQDYVR